MPPIGSVFTWFNIFLRSNYLQIKRKRENIQAEGYELQVNTYCKRAAILILDESHRTDSRKIQVPNEICQKS